MILTNSDYIDKQWEDIIDNIDKSNIPYNYISSIRFISEDEDGELVEQDIDIQLLKMDGYDDELIFDIIDELLFDRDSSSISMLIDIDLISTEVQMMTDHILRRFD